MASTYLTRTFGSAGNRQSWTWSGWIKKSKVYNSSDSGDREVFFGGYSANNDTDWLEFGTQGDILFATSSSTSTTSTQVLRDVNGWYNVLVNYNGSNLKFYINNELFKDSTDFSGNRGINVAGTHTIGALATNQSARRFTGLMSHVHFIDGTIYTPSAFGQYDANGVWTIKTSPSVTYGTNGFFILEDGNSVTDQSGNSNNFTVGGGTLTNTEDNPSNVFATCNALSKGSDWVFSKGNTNIRNDTNVQNNALGTIALHNGKYYWEVYRHGGGDVGFGITKAFVDGTNHTQVNDNRVLYYQDGNIYREGLGSNSPVNTGVTYGDTDTLAVAVDSINGVITFYKNGTQSGSITDTQLIYSNELWIPWFLGRSGSEMRINFGNGYFGTTAVASAGTNASGIGIFEYDVPTGYTALSTKGLNL
jgi:hypothetical protein